MNRCWGLNAPKPHAPHRWFGVVSNVPHWCPGFEEPMGEPE